MKSPEMIAEGNDCHLLHASEAEIESAQYFDLYRSRESTPWEKTPEKRRSLKRRFVLVRSQQVEDYEN